MKLCQIKKPIFTSLSPNVEKDDLNLVLHLILRPWLWKSKGPLETLKAHFKAFLGINNIFLFNSARAGFLAILRGLDLKPGSEILVQGFTCNALVNPIIWSRLKPVFVDIKKQTLNIDADDLEQKITAKTKVVVVQHTFGLPAEMDKISAVCKQHNLILIEDCAHCLGAEYNGQKLGTFGKASFFSFGRDKIISSVYGGAVAVNDSVLAEKIKQIENELDNPFYFWIFQQLLHPILTKLIIMPFYGFFGLGKWILIFLQKTRILSKAVHKKEKRGDQPNYLPQKMPGALAVLALHQFGKLDKILAHQKQIADIYNQNLQNLNVVLPAKEEGRIYLRYPLLFENQNTDEILKKARKQNLFLNDGWRKAVIVPPDTNQEKMGYTANTCPIAEQAAQQILNLPTHINIFPNDAFKIADFIKKIVAL